jgi:hypothetical protein
VGEFEWLILPLFLLRPFRCEKCDNRFHGLFFAMRVRAEAETTDDIAEIRPDFQGAGKNR